MDLLGLKPSAPAIVQYIDTLTEAAKASGERTPGIKSYPDAVYFNYYALGISLLFTPKNGYKPRTGLSLNQLQQDDLLLDSVDLYNTPESGVGDKSRSSRSKPTFATFPLPSLILPITAQVKDKDGKPITRPPQLIITLDTSGKDFVGVLGEPERKGGGTGPSSGSINIWCEWTNDGIMVEFGGTEAKGAHAWETGKDAVWKVITFFQPGTKRD